MGLLVGNNTGTVLRYQMYNMYNMIVSDDFISTAALKSVKFSVKWNKNIFVVRQLKCDILVLDT